ncbi:transcriptional regulator, GntR family [Pseudovibrio sp. FO-BEG1]|nr:transcriptional regulator, GntR family [Pseudovibrio sp. FO-BEG1]
MDEIYETLRERICLLDYPPGCVLRERTLAEEFGVSRTPIRTVLQRLEKDGLITSHQGRGTTVTTVNLADLRDIYFMRVHLAEAIAYSRPHAPKPDAIEEMQKLEQMAFSVADTPDYRTFAQISIGLHKQVQSIIRNKALKDFSDQLFYQTARIWFLLLPNLNWKEELEDVLEEIKTLKRFMTHDNVTAIGRIHSAYLSLVLSRLEGVEQLNATPSEVAE